MGTWGDGLYDSDAALDAIEGVVDSLSAEMESHDRRTIAALKMWLLGAEPDEWFDDLGDVAVLPTELQAMLKRYRRADDDPNLSQVDRILAKRHGRKWEPKGSRSTAVKLVLGEYCDGPRVDAIVKSHQAKKVLGRLADCCRQRMDAGLSSLPSLYGLAAPAAHLGILMELREAHLIDPLPAEEIAEWASA